VQRRTRQKQAVEAAFVLAGRPLSTQEVVILAQKTVPSLGIATAYRTIKDLVESGWLAPVVTPAGTCFELAAIEHHHHFFCRACSRTFDIPDQAGDVEGMTPRGFVPDGHELTVTGRCNTCAKSVREAARRP
jgi:Fur family transcriptional regulator, ferric uptake regulator